LPLITAVFSIVPYIAFKIPLVTNISFASASRDHHIWEWTALSRDWEQTWTLRLARSRITVLGVVHVAFCFLENPTNADRTWHRSETRNNTETRICFVSSKVACIFGCNLFVPSRGLSHWGHQRPVEASLERSAELAVIYYLLPFDCSNERKSRNEFARIAQTNTSPTSPSTHSVSVLRAPSCREQRRPPAACSAVRRDLDFSCLSLPLSLLLFLTSPRSFESACSRDTRSTRRSLNVLRRAHWGGSAQLRLRLLGKARMSMRGVLLPRDLEPRLESGIFFLQFRDTHG
jgi:hypothetical protein